MSCCSMCKYYSSTEWKSKRRYEELACRFHKCGLLPRHLRGPLCFDCPYEWSQSDCNKLALCEMGEVCTIEEYRWGEHSHFAMGCGHGQCEPTVRTCHVFRRSIAVCQACCHDDYCNHNCTRTANSQQGSIIFAAEHPMLTEIVDDHHFGRKIDKEDIKR